MKRITKSIATIAGAVALTLGLSACEGDGNNVQANDQKKAASQLDIYQKNQPVPLFDWSQYRATLIDILNAQVHGQVTTSFFFNQGVDNPIHTCPSIGFPVPTTAQLTNPDQAFDWHETSAVLPQPEQSGVYTGDSSGTYAVCVAPSGQKYIKYWEGFIDTVGAPAHWEPGKGIVLDGDPTVKVTTK